jgi:biotin synthase
MNNILSKLKYNERNSEEVHQKVLDLITELSVKEELKREEYQYLLDHISKDEIDYLFTMSFYKKMEVYGNKVFLRALIEISNYCKMGCKYCGINVFNHSVNRYRLNKEEILACCDIGYELGYKTFVLQGGEDSYYTDELLVDLIKTIKNLYPDTRITLSLGERSKESYKALYDAGADRYLLRHETASRRLYEYLHHDFMSFDNRRECLNNLKEIGYQVGAGFMVGTPTQTNQDLVEDLLYLKALNPHMVGVGPYLCHSETELKGNESGTLIESLVMVALVRLVLPKALLPATTALGTLDTLGREKALKAGANVMMPNISPTENRKNYEIYQNKICTGDTESQCRNCVESRVAAFDHEIDLGVGDYIDL